MKARVTVTLKTGILDPQGKAIEGALRSLGLAGVASVRQGKVFDIEIEGSDPAKAEALLKQAADQAARQYRDRELPRGRAGMKAAVVVFPGINRERDMARTLALISGVAPAMVWHADTALPAGTDLVVIPGGFSYGDYLRCGAIAARSAHHGGGARPCRQGRTDARRLQWLPDPLRSGPVAGRADAQCPAALHLPRRLSAGGTFRFAVHPRLQRGPGDPRAGRAWRGQLHRRRRHHRPAGRRGAGAVPLLLARGRRSIRPGTSTAPPTPSPASSASAATCSA